MASKVRWKVLNITGFVSAMVPSKSRITIFFILLVFYSYVQLFIVLHYFLSSAKILKNKALTEFGVMVLTKEGDTASALY